MTSFKKDIRKRKQVIVTFVILTVAMIVIAFLTKVNLSTGPIDFRSEWFIRLLSYFAGIQIIAIYRIVKLNKVLSDEKALEELYIKENDERNQLIALKACRSTVSLSMGFLGLSSIIASMFSETVFFTLVFVLVAILGLYLFLLLYFSKKI